MSLSMLLAMAWSRSLSPRVNPISSTALWVPSVAIALTRCELLSGSTGTSNAASICSKDSVSQVWPSLGE